MHINEMLNKKTYIGDIEPNPKEFGIWIKNDGSHMIYDYTNREWICNCGGSGSSKVLYYKVAAGVNIGDIIEWFAHFKLFDAWDNKFEYIPARTVLEQGPDIILDFSWEADEYCAAFLPLDIKYTDDGYHGVAHTLEEIYALMGEEMPAGVTRITEEEYWDDSVPTQFILMAYDGDNDIPYYFGYEKGMTWNDWFNSKYNYIPFKRNEDNSDSTVFIYADQSVPVWGDYIFGFTLILEDNSIMWDDEIENKTYYIAIVG